MEGIDGCCKEAVYECNKLGPNSKISAQTGKFPHPHPSVFIRNGRTPPLFEYCPKFILNFKNLICGDYDSFTVKRLKNDVICVVIPKYLPKATDIGETSLEYMLLSKYSCQPPSYDTICWWVCWMGFEQDSTKKHEKPDQKSNPGAMDGYLLNKKNSRYFNSLSAMQSSMRDTAT
ncbi:hypothetical protein ACHAWX_000295 [Stephanocyclus meneghinianus]